MKLMSPLRSTRAILIWRRFSKLLARNRIHSRFPRRTYRRLLRADRLPAAVAIRENRLAPGIVATVACDNLNLAIDRRATSRDRSFAGVRRFFSMPGPWSSFRRTLRLLRGRESVNKIAAVRSSVHRQWSNPRAPFPGFASEAFSHRLAQRKNRESALVRTYLRVLD